MTHIKSIQYALAISVCASAVVSLPSRANAQVFEAAYGLNTTLDQANRRVKQVVGCGAGTIAVGTSTPTAGGPSDIYVVRTAANGATVFERRYNIGAVNATDVGVSIAELTQAGNTGFIVLGTTNRATNNTDLFLMRISCNGAPLWTQIYTTAGTRDQAGDIVEATTGNAAVGTQPGDLLVSGTIENVSSTTIHTDGLLFRARAANGSLVWNRRYDAGAASEVFLGLIEARANGGATTGDIVVGGRSTVAGAAAQAYAQRVSGDNGLFVAAPHCAARHGATTGAETFESVVELRANAALPAHLVFAGASVPTASPAASDMYFVRTPMNPCQVAAQRTVGEPPTGPTYGNEGASDIQEIRTALPYAAAGRVVVTGFVGKPGTNAEDLPLLAIDPSTLIPIGGSGRLFGDHAARRERGNSLFPHATGILLAGLTESVVNEPRDVYLVSTNGNGVTNCNAGWTTPHYLQNWAPQMVAPTTTPILQNFLAEVTSIGQSTATITCP